jgi:hypothetical protein
LKNSLLALVLAIPLGLFSSSLHAQSVSINLEAINGKDGKPMPHQRLLVFMGDSQEDVRFHKYSQDVTTDEHGNAVLQIPKATIQWMQVFVDYRTLCQAEPNRRSFSLAKIVGSGEATPNDCSSVRKDLKPNQLVVFARPATLREKRDW